MSIDKSLYLDVYIKAKSKMKEHRDISLRCPHGHLIGSSSVFCPVCGSPTIEEETVNIIPMSFYDLLNDGLVSCEFEDEMLESSYRNDEYNVFTSNSGSFNIEDMDDQDVSLEDIDMFSRIVEFKEKHGDFIKAITPHYESVEIHYGIVVDYR